MLRQTISRGFAQLSSSKNRNLIQVGFNNDQIPNLTIYFAPKYEKQMVVCDPTFTIEKLQTLLTLYCPDSSVTVSSQNGNEVDPQTPLVRFLAQEEKDTLVFTLNDSFKYLLPNIASAPGYSLIQNALIHSKNPSSLQWFAECRKHQIPADQSNFLSSFLMNFEKAAEEKQGQLNKGDVQGIINSAMSSFSEPKSRAI